MARRPPPARRRPAWLPRSAWRQAPLAHTHWRAAPSPGRKARWQRDVASKETTHSPQSGSCGVQFLPVQVRLKLLERERIKHVAGLEPAAPSGADAQALKSELIGGVR